MNMAGETRITREENYENSFVTDDLRRVTISGEELFTLVIYPTIGEGPLLRHSPTTRTLAPQSIQTSRNHVATTTTSAGRGSRARNDFRRFVVHNKLTRAIVLRGADHPKALSEQFTQFTTNVRSHHGTFTWAAVCEFDKNQRPHLHVFTHSDVENRLLRDQWTAPHKTEKTTYYWSEILNTHDDLVYHALYCTKTFHVPAVDRPTRNRYRRSHAADPPRYVLEYVTRADIDAVQQALAAVTNSNVTTWTSESYWCPTGLNWTPNSATTNAVHELLQSYKPV
jgi:hypothetical protein